MEPVSWMLFSSFLLRSLPLEPAPNAFCVCSCYKCIVIFYNHVCALSHTHTGSIGTEIVEKQEAARKQNKSKLTEILQHHPPFSDHSTSFNQREHERDKTILYFLCPHDTH